MAVKIGREMGLSEAELNELRLGCLLHDVGKLGIKDELLFKPMPLTSEEFNRMKRHTQIGAHLLSSTPSLASLAVFSLSHHENFDGSGYPDGLKGPETPVAVRIVAISDSFEAMTSERGYKKPIELAAAAAEIRRCSGTQFDPEIVESFERIAEKLLEPTKTR